MTVHLHQSYWTAPVALEPHHRDDMHRLSVAVNWPHRPEDLAFLLALGRGFIARDEIGRPLGSGMVFPYGAEMAMIGMMMTHPRLQAGGLGALILDSLSDLAGTTRLRLNATKEAHHLYRSAGFEDFGRVTQYQGLVDKVPEQPAIGLREATVADHDRIIELDARRFGVARPTVIKALLHVSDTLVATDKAGVTGFAMCRLFGRGHVIGPLSATSNTQACALIAPILAAHAGGFVRLDADVRHEALGRFLNAAGLESYDTVFPMARGWTPSEDAHVYVLAGQALG
jgi:GNAT superfamily N-acetyltransferase